MEKRDMSAEGVIGKYNGDTKTWSFAKDIGGKAITVENTDKQKAINDFVTACENASRNLNSGVETFNAFSRR